MEHKETFNRHIHPSSFENLQSSVHGAYMLHAYMALFIVTINIAGVFHRHLVPLSYFTVDLSLLDPIKPLKGWILLDQQEVEIKNKIKNQE